MKMLEYEREFLCTKCRNVCTVQVSITLFTEIYLSHCNTTLLVCACKKVRQREKVECVHMSLCVCTLLSALVPFSTNII